MILFTTVSARLTAGNLSGPNVSRSLGFYRGSWQWRATRVSHPNAHFSEAHISIRWKLHLFVARKSRPTTSPSTIIFTVVVRFPQFLVRLLLSTCAIEKQFQFPPHNNSFLVLFDKIGSVYFCWKMYLYFSIGNGQPREPALCQLYRHNGTHFRSPLHVDRSGRCPLSDRKSISSARCLDVDAGASPDNQGGPIYKIFHDLSQDYRKFILRSTYDSDLQRPKSSRGNIVS